MATSNSTSNAPEGYKRCSKGDQCIHPDGPILPATKDYFSKSTNMADGLQYLCKLCVHEYNKRYYENHADKIRTHEKQYRTEHYSQIQNRRREIYDVDRDKILAQKKRWRESNRNKLLASKQMYRNANSETIKERSKQYYNKNREVIREKARRYQQFHQEHRREYLKRWRALNPEKNREQRQIRAARRRNLPATFTEKHWRKSINYFHGCCAYCGNPPSLFDMSTVLHQEHFVAVVNGGGYTPDNILPACQTCNLSKKDKDAEMWIVEYFGNKRGKTILEKIKMYWQWISNEYK